MINYRKAVKDTVETVGEERYILEGFDSDGKPIVRKEIIYSEILREAPGYYVIKEGDGFKAVAK